MVTSLLTQLLRVRHPYVSNEPIGFLTMYFLYVYVFIRFMTFKINISVGTSKNKVSTIVKSFWKKIDHVLPATNVNIGFTGFKS